MIDKLLQFDWVINIKMSKQAVLLVVDVGNSMDEAFSQNASRAKIALQCCKLTIQQKIFNNSSHELGMIIFGDNDSDDGNSLFLQNLQKPSIDLVRKVQQLSHAKFDNTLCGGDIFSAINFSLKNLDDHCLKKKYNKRLFVFTNGSGQSAFSSDEIVVLAQKLIRIQVKLNVIPIDFMVSYNCEENTLDGEMMIEKSQEQNAQMLMLLKRLAQEYVQIFPASLAIELYKRFRKKDTNPVARFKGALEFAPGLQIEVSTYKAIRRQKLKSLARYDTSIPFDPMIPEKSEVILEHNYVIQGDSTGKIVDKENIINAYYYGPQLVPISPILEAGSKIFEDKNLRLLGFIDKSKLPRHALMSDVDIVVPNTDDQASRKLFSAFIYSMISLNKYGLCRYVARNSKMGVIPRMVALIPYRSNEREMFYLIQLPTVEDVRQYPFNSLKQSTNEQKQLVRNLIEKMMLFNKEGEEEVKIQSTFNPLRQHFYQSIFHRALTDLDDLPPLDPVIKNYMSPEIAKYKQAQHLIPDVKKTFKLIKKLNLANKKKKAVIWKNLLQQLNEGNDNKSAMKEEETEVQYQFVKPQNKFLFEDEQEQMVFNPSNPILSFRKMINYNKDDLVAAALSQIKNYIHNKLTYSVTSESYKHLTECAAELRNACLSQQEQKCWDDWYMAMSENYETFYHYLKLQGLGLIQGNNVQVFKAESIHHEGLEDLLCDLD